MPIISDKHVVNISFKHVDSNSDGNESVTDVNAYLEDGVMQVKLKNGTKQIIVTANALKEICDYISQANSSNSISNTIESKHAGAMSSRVPHRNSLESTIFSSVNTSDNALPNQEGVDFASSNRSKNYASPTLIAASSAVSPVSGISNNEPSVVISKLSLSAGEETNVGIKKIRRKNSLNLGKDDSLDDDGRFVIDLTDEKE